MDDAQKIRNEIFAKYREDVLRRQLSNTESYDKAVLSLGTAFLGFSMAFLKDFVSYKDATLAALLPVSWSLFCLSIVATIVSFFVSQKGLNTQLIHAEKYYLENDDSYLNKKNFAASLTDFTNYGSAVSFILAVVTTIVFVVINLENGAEMSRKTTTVFATEGAAIPSMQQVPKGASVPTMQHVTSGVDIATAGAQVPAMQLAPTVSPATAPVASPASSPQPGSSSQASGGNTNSTSK
jgi:heme/copper-type cytochrome/quinol oxidase subunit 4